MRGSIFLCFGLTVTCLLGAEARGADGVAPRPVEPTLHLTDGDYLAGTLSDSDQPNQLCWDCPAFTSPFRFELAQVESIRFARPAEPPRQQGQFCFELAGGDLLIGSLVALSADVAELDLAGIGPVRVRRSHLRRILRWSDGENVLYVGPSGLNDWEVSPNREAWRVEGGHLVSEKDGAFVHRDFGLPPQVRVEFEISWTKTPDFTLLLATDGEAKHLDQSFRFEVWDNDLVAMRETADEADAASVMKLKPGPGRVRLQAFVDQRRGRMLVTSAGGERLAEIKVSGGVEVPLTGIRLINKRGDVRLEQLRVSRWLGNEPLEARPDTAHLVRSDGSVVYGEVEQFDAAAGQFVVNGKDGPTRIDAHDVRRLDFAAGAEVPARSVRAILHGGMRISGQLAKVSSGKVWLNSESLVEPISLTDSTLDTLMVLDREKSPRKMEGLIGRLELEGTRMHGMLVDSSEETAGADGASCLNWQPRGGNTASRLRHGISGRIVYRDPPPPKKKVANQRRRAGNARVAMGGFQLRAGNNPAKKPNAVEMILRSLKSGARAGSAKPGSKTPHAIYLRTGDTIPCKVTRIDEQGVHFQTPISAATFAAHDRIKALVLAKVSGKSRLTRAKYERLLTLPRMQKNNPPTHLIRSTNGDYVRGRLEAMDDETLRMEVRLESKQLMRQYVARIIWLHGAAADSENPPTPEPTTKTRVQALRPGDNRLTFIAQRVADATLHGSSDLLGPCHVALAEIDHLLIEQAIEKSVRNNDHLQWRLRDAVQPKFVTAGEGAGGLSTGMDSALVGKPAPDFELGLLSGKQFRLSDHRGKVVVLDFWASWCGHCIQAMPRVDQAVHDFQEQDVKLVAVNLQESADVAAATIERLDLTLAVALDQDGVVADHYNAVAIPQTVIIDADGKIVRHFVGGGPHIGDQLRDALTEILQEANPKEATP